MIKVLIVEDDMTNVKLLKFYVENFFNTNNIEHFQIDVANNGLEALGLNLIYNYDIMFLDVKMPKCDGIKVLNTFKVNKDLKKPFICMVTAMGEDKYKQLFKLLKANSFIIKPFDKIKVHEVIQKVVEKTTKMKSQDFEEEVDFDFYSFDDFDDFDDFGECKEEIGNINKTHFQVSAKEFLSEYDDISYMLEDIDEINDMLSELIVDLDLAHFEYFKSDLTLTIKKYTVFLNSLISFGELSDALHLLNNQIEMIQIDQYEEIKATYIVELVRAILEEISDWKDFVFIEQSATDVYYINASILSNCKQLEYLIKE